MRHMTFHKGTLFPEKLHCMLEYAEDQDLHDILTWTGNGLAFIVHNPDMLTMTILPIFFGATKYRSFVRQLNNWSFHRYTGYSAFHDNNSNSSSAIFAHPYFLRGKKSLCENLTRESFKRSSDNTSTAQISCSLSRHHVTKRNKNKTKRTTATAALHVQTQNTEDMPNNDSSSSPSSCSMNSQLSPSVVTMMDPEPPGFIVLTPCKSSDNIVLSSDAWPILETALLKANDEDGDDMTSFLDGDLIDFEGKQFYFLDLKP
jgi:HSF-type DNA-binding